MKRKSEILAKTTNREAKAFMKFDNYRKTEDGQDRAYIDLKSLDTLWINTGTLCNIQCANCYIESSPSNDRLVYITAAEVRAYLDEIRDNNLQTGEIAFTGGEPFMNPEIMTMLTECLERGFKVMVLTNAMRPMMRFQKQLLQLQQNYHQQLTLRISCDHYKSAMHEEERGPGTWPIMIEGLQWLAQHNFTIDIAGRTRWGDDLDELRAGYAALFTEIGLQLDAFNHRELVLFPEMDENAPVPEITTGCWDILGVSPSSIMCSTSRMIVKRKGAHKPAVIACTLIPYDEEFEFDTTLEDSAKRVYLNHQHCSKFCVLGGGSCSVAEEAT